MNYFKRIFSEMMNIHYQSNTLNRMEDTHFLKNAYKKTIDTIKKLHMGASSRNGPPSARGAFFA